MHRAGFLGGLRPKIGILAVGGTRDLGVGGLARIAGRGTIGGTWADFGGSCGRVIRDAVLMARGRRHP